MNEDFYLCSPSEHRAYSVQEQQLREAHLDEGIHWDKLTATIMQQMEHQRM